MENKDRIKDVVPMDVSSYIELLTNISLFEGIEQNDIGGMLGCLQASKKKFLKNETILRAGEVISQLGIILTGRGQIIREDIMGNRNILSNLEVGDMFAEAFACAGAQRLPFQVVAITDCTVMFLDYRRIVTTCSSSCYFHTSLIHNMMKILAVKNVLLTQKMEHMTKRSTREKLLSYLSEQAAKSNSKIFKVPFNRQELADYLCVDRSAMSNELSKLKDEGLIDFDRSDFRLLKEQLE
ncbi:Crp/Fnr family transcriptional regulator [Lachnoclostridium phytofermentans]|uniref:Cyclic nucleotide-binding protein n=1 Tax=Lachnoclostridium phytofermentans (strain ATCC 700394 / DSM 18823 / ISDg) TaxID=357809 RepID=A9KR25_LACP7|nr:Crp/Fnr family transcriptional regulator [Lachnoclostridium phytofermentans]ABX43504.1 cyclic nucleotide-binding protein [Lachnoclostridium phytofermentans ISDg]